MSRAEEFNTLKTLEESLWIPHTRYDNAYMERVMSPDFFEFGCSDRVYSRSELLPIMGGVEEIQATIPLKDFRVHPLAENVVLVTYISEVVDEAESNGVRVCNRSSIWVKSSAGWQIRFHQGTPVKQ